jgi:anaerobic selenocysteine-containing dehydrogenase
MIESRKNVCLLCSLGCGVMVDVEREEAVNLEYDTECPVNRGRLCSKGNYILELMNHPLRLNVAKKNGKSLRWKEAAGETAAAVRRARDKKAAAVVLAGDASCEDVGFAVEFAVNCMGNDRVALSFPTDDDKVVAALAATAGGILQATLDDVEGSACTIAVGDPFETCPVIAGRVLAARNAARANSLNVVSQERNTTSRFASVHLCGSERENMLALVAAVIKARGSAKEDWQRSFVEGIDVSPDAQRLAKKFVESEKSVVVVSTGDPVVAQLASALVKAAGDTKRLFPLHDYGNARAITEIFAGGASTQDVIESAARGEVDVLIVLGADLVASYPDLDVSGALSKVETVVVGAPFANQTTAFAGMVLPTALWLETDGTFNGGARSAVVEPPGGAMSYGNILKAVSKAMDVELRAPSPSKAIAEKAIDKNKAVAIASAAREEERAKAPIRSTALRFADGSLTDRVCWMKMVEKVH